MSDQRHDPYAGWAIVELFGHRRLAGRVAQVEQYGQATLRLDMPREDGTESTHFYGGSSLYGVHPTTEDIARHVAVAWYAFRGHFDDLNSVMRTDAHDKTTHHRILGFQLTI